jgi:hypothetical protein
MNPKNTPGQIQPDHGNLRHDRSPLWIVTNPPWHTDAVGGRSHHQSRSAGEGLVAFAPNPHHKRAQLVALTAKGRDAYDAAIALYRPQVNALAAVFSAEELTASGGSMQALRARLESDAG